MRNPKRNVMNAINMNRLALLEIVRGNKQKHIDEFNESIIDYQKLVLQIAAANLKLAKTAELEEFKKMKPQPQAPQSYESSYVRAIRMLELSIDETIEIEEDVFNQLVLDEWHWKHSFTVSNAFYKSAGAY